MSVYVIYYKNGKKWMRPVRGRAEYEALRDSEANRGATKLRMVQMAYSCRPATEDAEGCGPLKGSTRLSNTVGMDVDLVRGKDETDEAWALRMKAVPERVLAKKEALGLRMLERSATKGYHLVFGRRWELTQEENLRWASELLGVEYDPGAKDVTRVFFTPADALLYVDDCLFETGDATARAAEASDDAMNGGTSGAAIGTSGMETSDDGASDTTIGASDAEVSDTGISAAEASNAEASDEGKEQEAAETKVGPEAGEYHGFSYAEIVKKYWDLFNDGKEPVVGDRNVKTYELAMTLRPICDYDLGRMMAVIPRYDGFEEGEYRRTLENALKEPRKGMPYRLRQVLLALKSEGGVRATGGTLMAPPPMPTRLPKLIRLLTKNVPWYYKPAVSSAVFPALATHLHGARFRYWDNVEHEATFMNVLVGRQSVGKGCVKKPIEFIMADIVERDKLSRQREAEWKRNNPMGKSKAKDPRPQDICIQMLIDNLTDAVFNQRIVDANQNGERYVYTIVDEIEALRKVTSKGTTDEVLLLIRKAFDNSLAGQERVGADSVSGIAPLRWNWNASTTPPNVRRFFAKGVSDGTISRLDVSAIFMPEDEGEEPVMGIYDEDFAEELRPYVERLETASGLIECPAALRLVKQLREENREMARLYDSEAYKVLSYRANVIAWLKGMLLYIAQGYKWDKTIADFVRWTEQYNLWCKMLYFGQQLEQELKEEDGIQRASGPQNLLDLLPDEFTTEQYRQMRASQGKMGDGASTLRTWMSRGYVELDEVVGCYRKTEEYMKRHGAKGEVAR